MRNKILNIFFHALAASKGHILALVFGLAITSCGLEEPYGGLKNNEGVIEFVARPVGFNDQIVDTKATVAEGDLETKIYSCYFLVFDTTTGTGNGKLIHCSDNLVTGTTPITSIPPQRLNISKKGVKTVKACFIVNVPKNFIYNETNDTPLLNNLTALNAAVLGPEHFSYATNSATVPMGTPQMTINGVSGVKCIPAFGMTSSDINLESGAAAPVQITIKRLFAKVSVNLKVALAGLSDFESAIQALTHYEVQTLKLYNIPTKVKLVEDNVTESAWRTATSQYTTTPMQKSRINTQIYNNSDNGYSYYFYVPEFYLDPIADPTQKQEFKPKNYPDSDSYRTYPVYIQIEGSFVKYSINSATINYKIYLGGNNIDNFSIARNTHYTNDLTILNTNKNSQDQNNLDHRVTTTTINNPVAKAGKAANCYVISAPGDYSFPAYMGAYNNLQYAVPCEGGVDVEILVNKAQFDGSSVSAINISNEAYDPVTNMISFSVASEPVINVVPNGNVVIALLDRPRTNPDRQVIWSWHLWFSTDFSGGNESEWATIRTQKYPNAKEFMDRNLGANIATSSAVEGLGLYYRFNNKNPFIESAYIGGGVNGTATFNPANDSNQDDDTKAVHDPCPPGYRVPKFDEWPSATPKHVNLDVTGLFGSSGVMLFYDQANLANDVYYPYSGYRSGTQVQYKTQDDREYTTPSTYTVTESDDDVEIKSGTKWNDKEQTGIRTTTTTTYYNYVYTVPIASTSGYLLGQDKALYYENTEDKIDIAYTNMHVLRCNAIDHVKVENVKRSRRLITTAWGLIPWESVSTISEEDGEEYTVTNHRSFTLNQAAINNTENKTRLVSTYATPDSSHGYQIRCIKE